MIRGLRRIAVGTVVGRRPTREFLRLVHRESAHRIFEKLWRGGFFRQEARYRAESRSVVLTTHIEAVKP